MGVFRTGGTDRPASRASCAGEWLVWGGGGPTLGDGGFPIVFGGDFLSDTYPVVS